MNSWKQIRCRVIQAHSTLNILETKRVKFKATQRKSPKNLKRESFGSPNLNRENSERIKESLQKVRTLTFSKNNKRQLFVVHSQKHST